MSEFRFHKYIYVNEFFQTRLTSIARKASTMQFCRLFKRFQPRWLVSNLFAALVACTAAGAVQAQSSLAQRWDFNDPVGTALPAVLNSAPSGILGQWTAQIAGTATDGSSSNGNGNGSLRMAYNGSTVAYSYAPINVASADVYLGTIVFKAWDIRNGAASGSTRPIMNFGFRSAASSSSSLVADVQFTASATGVTMGVRDSISNFATIALPSVLPGALTLSLKVDRRVTPIVYTLSYAIANGISGTASHTAAANAASNTRIVSHVNLAVSGNLPGSTNAVNVGPNVAPLIDSIAVAYNELPIVDLPPANGRPSKKSNLLSFFDGNPVQSSQPPVGGPGLLLMGGGPEVNAAFTGRAYPIVNGGDIVVLRISGSNGYQPYFFTNLVNELPEALRASLQPNSVETLFVDTRDKANSAYVANAVAKANMVWMAGGDQSAYIDAWRDTALAQAVRTAYARGAVIGGTSAGMVVAGEWMYDPGPLLAATSAVAVANPYEPSIILSGTKLFDLPLGFNLLTEPHFANRDRMGRTLAFMARLRKDARTSLIYGVALDEATSLFINANNIGTFQFHPVAGKPDGSGYILREDRRKTQLVQVSPGLPLIYRNAQRIKLASGQSFDFARGLSLQAPTTPISVEGVVPANPY